MHRFSTGKTLRCLLLVGCTTAITVEEWGRNIHHALPLQVSMSCYPLSPGIDERERCNSPFPLSLFIFGGVPQAQKCMLTQTREGFLVRKYSRFFHKEMVSSLPFSN